MLASWYDDKARPRPCWASANSPTPSPAPVRFGFAATASGVIRDTRRSGAAGSALRCRIRG